jgi:hypothetical protein
MGEFSWSLNILNKQLGHLSNIKIQLLQFLEYCPPTNRIEAGIKKTNGRNEKLLLLSFQL